MEQIIFHLYVFVAGSVYSFASVQAVTDLFQHWWDAHQDLDPGSKKDFQNRCWTEWNIRQSSQSYLTKIYDLEKWTAPPRRPAPARTPVTVAPITIEESPPIEKSEDMNKKAMELTVARLAEESHCREMLEHTVWISHIPTTDTLLADKRQLQEDVEFYVKSFQWKHMAKYKVAHVNLRLLTVETMRSLEWMQQHGWLPKSVTHPRDRATREAAAENCSQHYDDPGNFVWDVIYHCLRMDRFLVEGAAMKVLKTAASEYGAATNKSSKGVANLRGNIMESLLYHLQRMGEDKEGASWHHSGSGGSESQGWQWSSW